MASNRNPMRNTSGCMDLTAFYAIRNIERKSPHRGGREPKTKRCRAKSAHETRSHNKLHKSDIAKMAKGRPSQTVWTRTERPCPKPQLKPYPRIYICSPFGGDTEANTASAATYAAFALSEGYFPIAPHLYLPHFMDDANPAERELALSFGLRLLSGCKELWVFGSHISSGMAGEISEAGAKRMTVRYFDENCVERKAK